MGENTLWYTITYASGSIMLNFSKITRIQKNGGAAIEIYAGDVGAGVVIYNFNTTAERDDTYNKIKRVLNAIDISNLPPQTD